MIKAILFAVAIGSTASGASAAPLLNQANTVVGPSLTQEVRVVCEENGVCNRPPGRRLVARWVYGDGAFYGPYDGPRYYGGPERHYRWSFLHPWTTW
jgi:hypothetical protein